MPEAAAVMNDYAGRPEDNVVSSQVLDGNSSVCLLHPEERTQGTWRAGSLQLRHIHALKHHTCKHNLSHLCIFSYIHFGSFAVNHLVSHRSTMLFFNTWNISLVGQPVSSTSASKQLFV